MYGLRTRLDWRFASLFALFLAAYGWIMRGAGVREITDTALYKSLAAQNLSFSGVFAGPRPPLYPLVIRFCGGSDRTIVAAQIVLYLASWTMLAWVLYRPLHAQGRFWPASGLALAAFTAALHPDFAGWNHLIMTESLSLSFLVSGTALLVRFLQNGRGRDLVLFVCTALANSLLRDVAGYAALLFLLPLGVIAWRRMARPGTLLLSGAILLASAAFVGWSADRPGEDPMTARWVFPLLDVVGRNILPDPAAVGYFRAHGMPMNAALLGMTGKFAAQGKYDWQFMTDPELQGFRQWLVTKGKPTYLQFLATHPRYTASHVWADRDDLFQAFAYRLDPYPDTRNEAARRPKSERITYDTDFPPRLPLIVWYGVALTGSLALIGLGIAHRRRTFANAGCVLGAMGFTLLPLAVIIEHGDAMETARHAISIPAQGALVALAVLFFVVRDSFISARSEPDTPKSKQSFFEKKDQKTFLSLLRDSNDKSFLLLFFKKEGLAFTSMISPKQGIMPPRKPPRFPSAGRRNPNTPCRYIDTARRISSA